MTTPCKKCGTIHTRCAGHTKAGGACKRHPKPGIPVCKFHGGDAPQVLAAAKTREVEATARRALHELWAAGAEPKVDDPLTELARVAAEVVAFKDYLRDQVTGLDDVLAYWTETTFDDGTELRTTATEQLRAVVTAYERALDRTAKVLAAIVKLDLAERMVTMDEQKAEVIVTVVTEGLSRVDMPTTIRDAARDAIADALEQYATGAKPKELNP